MKDFKLPPCTEKHFHLTEIVDTEYQESAGESIYVVSRSMVNPDNGRPATNTGVRPLVALDRKYRVGQLPENHLYYPGELVTRGLLCGPNKGNPADAFIKKLVDSQAVVEVGKLDWLGGGVSYTFTESGVDFLYDVAGFIDSRMVRQLGGKFFDALPVTDGKLFTPTRTMAASGFAPSTFGPGWLVSDSVLALSESVEVGTIKCGEVKLTASMMDVMRIWAVLEFDREKGKRQKLTDEQSDYIEAAISAATK